MSNAPAPGSPEWQPTGHDKAVDLVSEIVYNDWQILAALRAALAAGDADVAEALGLRADTGDDGHRPHRFPESAIGEEVISWKCAACGEWVREFSSAKPTDCPVDWRSSGKRRFVTDWTEVTP